MPTPRTRTRTPVAETAERLLPAMGVWVFYMSFAGQGVRNVIGWLPFAAVAGVSTLLFWLLFRWSGREVTWRRIPSTVSVFVLWCCLSIIWSAYRVETAVASVLMVLTTLVGVLMAIAFPLRQLLGILTRSLQWMLGLSLALELFVAVVWREPLAPLYMRNWAEIPPSYYWIHGLLFEGGPIQGVFANRNPMGFGALLALICFLMQYWLRIRSLPSTLVWSTLAIFFLAMTRSATVTLCAISCTIIFLAVAYLRGIPREKRSEVSYRIFMFAVFGGVGIGAITDSIFIAMGRSTDLTGRGVIWERLLDLWVQKPILGWGWVMYWPPWLSMFKTLVVRPDGTPTMQAHNAVIEALFQTGLVGAVLLVTAMVWVGYWMLKAAIRSSALDRSAVWAMVLLTALLVQSLSESRLLSEGNWVLFVAFATWLSVHGYRTRIAESLLSRREVAAAPTR